MPFARHLHYLQIWGQISQRNQMTLTIEVISAAQRWTGSSQHLSRASSALCSVSLPIGALSCHSGVDCSILHRAPTDLCSSPTIYTVALRYRHSRSALTLSDYSHSLRHFMTTTSHPYQGPRKQWLASSSMASLLIEQSYKYLRDQMAWTSCFRY